MSMNAREAYKRIFEVVIPDTTEFFKSKTKDYEGGPAFQLLGSRGQFADINRKFWKLYQNIWEGKPLEGEQAEEIIKDMIGHLWLTLQCLRDEKEASLTKTLEPRDVPHTITTPREQS